MKPNGGEVDSSMVDHANPHDELLEQVLDQEPWSEAER